MASQRQILANRENARLHATGPKSDCGKQIARQNALKHGHAAEVLLTDEQTEAVRIRLEEWRPNYRLLSSQDVAIFEQMVTESVRVEACQADQARARIAERRRALRSWDVDRRNEAKALGGKLPKDPKRVAWQLESTRHGAEWMIAEWKVLEAVMHRKGEWSESQKHDAHDLLGVPRGDVRLDIPLPPPAECPALVAREIARLEELKAQVLDEQDEEERIAAEEGYPLTISRKMQGLRRYEAQCHRRYQKAADLIRDHRLSSPAETPAPAPEPEPEPEPAPAPAPVAEAPPPAAESPATERTQCDTGQAGSAPAAFVAPVAALRPGHVGVVLLGDGQVTHTPGVAAGL